MDGRVYGKCREILKIDLGTVLPRPESRIIKRFCGKIFYNHHHLGVTNPR